MSVAFETVMDRQPALQTITWLLNLKKFDQLDLDPPYQRKSVWSLREKQRFLDTILRNYPSPALFLHVTYDEEGNVTYHVVDGKQRISTILDFVEGKIRLAKDTGDNRLDGAKWADLSKFPGIRKNFWTYQVTVEQIDDIQEPLVREIFERLNRNSRKLEAQELRHAQFDGWLISYLEEEAERPIWKELKVSSRAKARRMSDVQQLSEFAQVVYERSVVGFDQDALTRMYSDLEDPEETAPDFDQEIFRSDFEAAAQFLLAMERVNGSITTYATSRTNIYPLWCWIVLNKPDIGNVGEIANRYVDFMATFTEARKIAAGEQGGSANAVDENVQLYLHNFTGASTEAPQREKRYAALSSALSS
jgi:hypothetical protein